MQGFLFMLGLMSILIAFGVFLSLRLNKGGLVGKRRPVRARSIRTVAAAEDYGVEEVYESFGPTVSTSSIRARGSLVVFIAGSAIVLTLVAGLLNILPH
jgi:hypothetical protein